VRDSILFEGVDVGRNCRIERAIVDKGVHVPDGTMIGVNHADDLARGLTVSEGGIVAVARNVRF
jgi:glucose-1-phosphate adenylyltransferase